MRPNSRHYLFQRVFPLQALVAASFSYLTPLSSVANADNFGLGLAYSSLNGSAEGYAPVSVTTNSFALHYTKSIHNKISGFLGFQMTADSQLSGFFGGISYDYEPHLRSEEEKLEDGKPSYRIKVYENWNLRGSLAVGRWIFSDQILKANGRILVPVRAEDLICILISGSVSRIFWENYSLGFELSQLSTVSGSFNASQSSAGIVLGYWLD